MHYTSVIVGGTFDRLHKGHKALLSQAFDVGKQVTIGVTTDGYVKKFKSQSSNLNIASYAVRKIELEQWLSGQGWNGRYMIIPLDDPYGPAVCNSPFDAIVVSSETKKTADEINVKRNELRLVPLAIVEIPLVPAEDLQSISSTRIRKGVVNQDGKLILPEILREKLKETIGELLSTDEYKTALQRDFPAVCITVGDMTTHMMLEFGMMPTLAIIDFQMERQPFLWDVDMFALLKKDRFVCSVQSGPGYISQEAVETIHIWGQTQKPTTILVDGEEDLLVLPVMIEAPIGSVLYYGQPRVDKAMRACFAGSRRVEAGQPRIEERTRVEAGQPHEGVVRVVVTEKKKQEAKELLEQFVLSGRS